MVSFSFQACNYQVQWGDGQTDNSSISCASGAATTPRTLTHTYSSAGTYTIRLQRDSQTDTAGVTIVQ
jgi:hypothetical protein